MTSTTMQPHSHGLSMAGNSAEGLRAEIRAVLSDVTASATTGPTGPGPTDPRPFYRALGARGLLAPSWPAAFGGRSLPPDLAAVVVEELVTAGVPDTPYTLSVQICGGFLLGAGSPAQRASVLPLLAAGRRLCAVLYSEQDAGSDLAGLRTTAQPAADGGWRLSGRKLWSVSTPMADLALVAARTSQDSSHYQGLTLFLLPLDAPGITIRELPSLADEAFAEVLLDDVPVGPGDVIGPVGGAWPLITEALALERTGADHVAKARTWLTLAMKAAETSGAPEWRLSAGRLVTRTAAARALSQQFLAEMGRSPEAAGDGQSFAVRAAATKLWCSEIACEVSDWMRDVLGDAVLWPSGDPGAVAGGRLEAARREAPGLIISAGTSEMMREVVAVAGLAAAQDGDDQQEPGDIFTGGAASGGLLGTGAPALEPLLADLTAAVRVAVRSDRPGDHAGDPGDRADDRAWSRLAGLGVFGLDLPVAAGGLALGPRAELAVCRELGAQGYDDAALDTLTAAAVLASAAAAGDEHSSTLAQLLDGRRRAALLLPGRPDRPGADPGEDGLLLLAPALEVEHLDDAWIRLDPAAAGLQRQQRTTAAGPVLTLALPPALPGARPGSQLIGGVRGRALLARDLLRRAAWLIGAADASLAGTLRYARTRRQFGTSLLSNQALAHRLADLAVHGTALRALLDNWAGFLEESDPDDSGEAGGPEALPAAAGLLAEAGRYARDASEAGIHLRGAAGMLRGSSAEKAFHAVTFGIARGPAPALLDRLAAVSGPSW